MRESAETSWNTPAFINHINAADNSQWLHSDSASCKSLWKDPSRISLGQTCNWVLHFRYECFEHWANTAAWNPLKLRCNSDVTQGSKPSFSFFRSLRTHFVCVCVCVCVCVFMNGYTQHISAVNMTGYVIITSAELRLLIFFWEGW